MILVGDCVELMRGLEEASVDAVVTDPPYGIRFMGKAWDGRAIERAANERRDLGGAKRLTGSPDSPNRKLIERTGSAYANAAGEAGAYDFSLTGNRAFQLWSEQWACEAFRILKPGGYLLSFAGTRTYHRMVSGIEDAGFEIRDTLCWLYGSGFPKSRDVSKAIDRAAGAEREVVGNNPNGRLTERESEAWARPWNGDPDAGAMKLTAPATDDARRWQGWGTALKPAHEPIVVARKPLTGTVAANVLEHGTGALNVDGCRVPIVDVDQYERNHSGDRGHDGTRATDKRGATDLRPGGGSAAGARWPANIVLDEEAAAMLDKQTGDVKGAVSNGKRAGTGYGEGFGVMAQEPSYADSGGASRFFYVAKASRAERNAGLEGFEERAGLEARLKPLSDPRMDREQERYPQRNHHPTVKPVALMRWLVRLVTPPAGLVLDPFAGSGTTGIACALEGFEFLGMEQDADYAKIAEARIAFWTEHGEDGLRIVAERDAAERVREEIAASGQLDLLTGAA